MATVSTPVRQPFGVLNQSKLRNLESIKNRQNALTAHSAPNLKRRAPSPELSDSENVDPSFFESLTKRKRASFEDDVSLAKQPRLHPKIVTKTPVTSKSISPPRLDTCSNLSTTPVSAPPAAGRSPTRLRGKSEKSQPKRRFVPPSLGTSSPSLSIAAALRGTLAHKKPSRIKKPIGSLDGARPKSWFFDIFEESEEHQDYRMSEWTMTQSSAALDISDDESKSKPVDSCEKHDKGKENVDPNEMLVNSAPVTRAAAAAAAARAEQEENAMKTEEPRSPLGDLNAADYYGEGLNAASVVLVHDDDRQEIAQDASSQGLPEASPAVTLPTDDFTFGIPIELSPVAPLEMAPVGIPEWARKPSLDVEPKSQDIDSAMPMPGAGSTEIEIWESESAKDENEQHSEQFPSCVVIEEGQSISLVGGCLQEL